MGTFAWTGDGARLHEVLKLTFGPIIALLGSVIGFYFGTKKSGAD
jgi:hypothetical protein